MKGLKAPPPHVRPLIAFAILVLAGGAWWYTTSQPGVATGLATASGTIEADEIALAVEVGGRVERLAVDEGDAVRAGDVLVELDKSLLQAQIRQAQSTVGVAQANLALVEKGTRAEDVRAAEAALAQAVAQRDAARKAWENVQAIRASQQDVNLQIDAARSQVEIAQARRDQVNKGSARAEVAAAEAGVEAARAALVQAQAATDAEEKAATATLEAAQARLDALLAGPTAEQVREAEAMVRTARNQLYATQSQGDIYLSGGNWVGGQQKVPYSQDLKEAQSGIAWEQVQAAEARLAQLTAAPRDEAMRQAQAAVDQAQAQLGARRQTREDTVAAASANLQAAEARLQRVHEGATGEERRIASAAAVQATQQLKNLEAIRDNPLALNAQVDAAQGQYQAAEGAVQVAQARLEALKAGATAEQAAVARAQVGQAQAALGVLEAQLAKTTLRAPSAGLVTKRLVHAGETVAPGATLLTTADVTTLKLVVYVPETRVGLVRLGQPVAVSVDSFPGETFAGEVTFIAARAEFTPRNVQSQRERANTVFAVKVRIPNADGRLKPGMPADARLGM